MQMKPLAYLVGMAALVLTPVHAADVGAGAGTSASTGVGTSTGTGVTGDAGAGVTGDTTADDAGVGTGANMEGTTDTRSTLDTESGQFEAEQHSRYDADQNDRFDTERNPANEPLENRPESSEEAIEQNRQLPERANRGLDDFESSKRGMEGEQSHEMQGRAETEANSGTSSVQ